ncbi:unnamed protein product [Aspergillus oryzae RIB40]|uniref:DNA, SC001 n=1 Tax=Aspergillus oryzae (strain ATCC 42149 / RIB 40) TaxID=510516 RepID=Q2UNY6_ASPOR|nr:unnamed protein product [Aspergillus oryzae RIB40]BAE56729.1 unnamed protein product [Aspergillus oryzae RIB40]
MQQTNISGIELSGLSTSWRKLFLFITAIPRILAHLPLSALFILFDLVIHNPTHPETASNLALLEVAGGHFSRLEYATGGSLPSSVLAEFAYIARTFVRTYRVEGNDGSTIAVPTNVNIDLPRRQDDSLPSAASFLENENTEAGAGSCSE